MSASICSIPYHQVEHVITAAARLGANSVSVVDSRGRPLASVGSPLPSKTRPGSACRAEVSAAVTVSGETVATVTASGFDSDCLLEAIAETAAMWLGHLWQEAGELDSLASEIVHAYEELHLLYELGESLTSQFDVASAAEFVLQKIVVALKASSADLRLTDGTAFAYERDAGTAVVTPDAADARRPLSASGARETAATHCVSTSLRSAGEVVGGIEVRRESDEDPFTSVETKLFDAVGTLAANAIHNAQLHGRAREQAQALRESEMHLRALMENVADGIITVDEHGTIRSSNRAADSAFGYEPHEMIGQHFRTLLVDSQAHLLSGDDDAAQRRTDLWFSASGRREVLGCRRNGTTFPMDVAISHMQSGAQRVSIMSVRDITERKRTEQLLEHQALHDALTDLPNRTLLHDRLQHALVSARRNKSPLALLVLDLDRFKEVNDTFGHQCGDLLLRQVAVRLQDGLRRSDTVARMGGDEFAMVLPGADVEAAEQKARLLIKALEQPFFLEGHHFVVGASVGIALYPDQGEDASELLRRADVAMYLAKRGQSGFRVYAVEQDDYSPDRVALFGELRRAIECGELVLHYQPKVEYGGHVAWVEALVRWNHPTRGLLSPAQFIPLAEQTGLIRQLSTWVVDEALRQCRVWLDEGLHLPVAVNLSTRNLHDADLPQQIVTLLNKHRVPPSLLKVEVTESSLMADLSRAMDVLSDLRATDVHVAIDDFGTGYSSLAYLKNLPITEVKIDRSFVRHMVTDRNDEAIVRSTIALSHELGLQVVAEGVEDEATWDLLSELGCDLAQGFFVSRPLSAGALSQWVAARRGADAQPIAEASGWPTPRSPRTPGAWRGRTNGSARPAELAAAVRP